MYNFLQTLKEIVCAPCKSFNIFAYKKDYKIMGKIHNNRKIHGMEKFPSKLLLNNKVTLFSVTK